jgi:hypothetical protein
MNKKTIGNLSESSPLGRQRLTREGGTRNTNPRLTREQLQELEAIRRMPDDEIDVSEVPEANLGSRSFFFRDRHKFLEKHGKRRKNA